MGETISDRFPWKAYHKRLDNGDYEVGYMITDETRALEYANELKVIAPYRQLKVYRADILHDWFDERNDFIDTCDNTIDFQSLVDHFVRFKVEGYCDCYISNIDDYECFYNPFEIQNQIEWCYRDVLLSKLREE